MAVDARMTEVVTAPCPHCGRRSHVTVPEEAYERFLAGVHVQDALPGMPASERELLLTGFHDACWNEVFGEEEEE